MVKRDQKGFAALEVVYQGNGDVPSDVVAEHGIPEEWLGPQLTD